jgi:predicted acyl esterase
MLVTDGMLRARYHKSFEKETFLEPGQVYELNMDPWSTSLVLTKGHRIRIPLRASRSLARRRLAAIARVASATCSPHDGDE